jgi:hypothetical protein
MFMVIISFRFPLVKQAGELNTLGNFQRADTSFSGYFSVRVNSWVQTAGDDGSDGFVGN